MSCRNTGHCLLPEQTIAGTCYVILCWYSNTSGSLCLGTCLDLCSHCIHRLSEIHRYCGFPDVFKGYFWFWQKLEVVFKNLLMRGISEACEVICFDKTWGTTEVWTHNGILFSVQSLQWYCNQNVRAVLVFLYNY